jgi:peptidoglycan/LPS O-acetylase OafA/YrhL
MAALKKRTLASYILSDAAATQPKIYPLPARLPMLDGWRGISISCVLAGHMLPLGPKVLGLNGMVANAGMSLFFFLSGFLIVSMLSRNDNVLSFLARRVFRIVPLAWAFLIAVLLVNGASIETWQANLLFYANLPFASHPDFNGAPLYLIPQNTHFWSLCIEMQFYAAIALIVALAGRRGLIIVPIACVIVTAARAMYGVHASIVTWWRIDEILVGGIIALAFSSQRVTAFVVRLPTITPMLIAPLLLLSGDDRFGPLNYARPYLAALLIGSTIIRRDDLLQRLLCGPALGYLAKISYALYVIHPATMFGWLGEGDVAVRYLKRIVSFILSFLFAHLSTNYYERYWIALGHRLAARVEKKSERHVDVAKVTGNPI